MKNLLMSLLFVFAPAAFAQNAAMITINGQLPMPLPQDPNQPPAPPAPPQNPPAPPAPAPQPVDQYYNFNFGNWVVGSRVFQDFTLTASPQGPVSVRRITIAGGMYSANSNCPAVLPAGAYCTTRVWFWPNFPGTYWGRLTYQLQGQNIFVDLVGSAWR